jgi:hypothetical protein
MQDYCDRFHELIAIVNPFEMVLCSIVVGSLPVKVSGLDRALQMTHSHVIHVTCFVNMVNLVSASTVSMPNFSGIMDHGLSCRSQEIDDVAASDSQTRCRV